jgi:protein phosphatase 2C-like protein
MPRWTWAAASARGTSHALNQTRCQDAQACRSYGSGGTRFVGIVADGAGSAPLGGEGASLACRSIDLSCREHFAQTENFPDEHAIASWVDLARDRLALAAKNRNVPRRQLASTLLVAIGSPDALVTAHIGDGAIVYRGSNPDDWQAASWPAHGEFANTTYFLTDEPAPPLRFAIHQGPIGAVAAFTDGIERLVLNFATKTPHSPFFKQMVSSIESSHASGRDVGLSVGLGQYLDSAQINERTDDDKTLVLAAFR